MSAASNFKKPPDIPSSRKPAAKSSSKVKKGNKSQYLQLLHIRLHLLKKILLRNHCIIPVQSHLISVLISHLILQLEQPLLQLRDQLQVE